MFDDVEAPDEWMTLQAMETQLKAMASGASSLEERDYLEAQIRETQWQMQALEQRGLGPAGAREL